MQLSTRLAVTTVAAGLPLIACYVCWQRFAYERTEESSLVQLAFVGMQNGQREACEASPETWSGDHNHPFSPRTRLRWHGKKVRIYAYDAHLRSRNTFAPGLSTPIRSTVKLHSPGATHWSLVGLASDCGSAELVKMPWSTGPCAYSLVCRVSPHSKRWSTDPFQVVPIAMCVAVAAVLLAIGPAIRRMRRLTREVQHVVQDNYHISLGDYGDDEIGDLAKAFAQAAHAVREQAREQQQHARALREFLENTTHDVMIPLTVLQAHLVTLREQCRAQDQEVLGAAMGEAHYIASLLHNLAAAAKLDSRASKPHSLANLNDLVSRAVARHKPLGQQNGVALDRAVPAQPVWVTGDVTLMEQAVSNIVYNAVRHNHEGGHAAVVLDMTDDGGACISVVDDGPGIAAHDMARLMQRHQCGNNPSRSRDPGGHGLGLSIAQRVCQAHGWTLRLTRSEFGGLQVDLIIPANLVSHDDTDETYAPVSHLATPPT